MTIYLSGIHNETDSTFLRGLKEQIVALGCTIVAPEENATKKLSWTEDMSIRMNSILASDTMFMLPKWRESTIARIELTAAMNEKKHLCFTIDDIKDLITTLDG
ncbi:DUF4406 domain-containing protein [Carboxylicivirga sp. N1Y90]|uniref:DUF4406 domain-containing protein n=1 Tax=Carboxylicivirga fragile TaxID=3417571 RepID=UPI003D351E45|nr:DUF4406 domain-containing protein [Marinilabiliaceae bacterium N1Y90]